MFFIVCFLFLTFFSRFCVFCSIFCIFFRFLIFVLFGCFLFLLVFNFLICLDFSLFMFFYCFIFSKIIFWFSVYLIPELKPTLLGGSWGLVTRVIPKVTTVIIAYNPN